MSCQGTWSVLLVSGCALEVERNRSQHFVVSCLSVRCVDPSSTPVFQDTVLGTRWIELRRGPWVVICRFIWFFYFDLFRRLDLLFLLIAEAPMRNTPMHDVAWHFGLMARLSQTYQYHCQSRSLSLTLWSWTECQLTYRHLITPTLFLLWKLY